ncbi:hypothetical protein C0V75_19355 [Tabrizicola sp. TH137]|uniref:hypothetical protein n=1 Tax=Tabrizicola sp. TH137 TaxID=2067452 RepID=UPI000C796D17|nr:hypothetical protein [Tabrizicola sp. TH137]PLL10841.1 hypothetical protein C0V75_19355 [Tabrizicola sp. TH137]
METKSRLLTLTAAALLAGTTSLAQAQQAPVVVSPAPTTPTAPTYDFGFLTDLFGGTTKPSRDAVEAALDAQNLTLTRYSYAGDGEVRIRAVTEDGQRIRVRIEDGELRYRIRPASDSSDTSDSNGDTSDSNGSSTGSSDANGATSGGGNGGGSGKGGGNGGGSKD